MKVKVLLFAHLRERMGFSEKEMEFVDTNEVQTWLETTHPDLARLPYKVAVNQNLIGSNVSLNEGDEIAVMPPFAGG